MPLPVLTDNQRRQAAQTAQSARRTRSVVRSDLKSGQMTVADVLRLAQSDPAVARLRVVTLLESLPGIGETKAQDILTKCQIAQSRRVRGLGVNQRDALLAEVGRR